MAQWEAGSDAAERDQSPAIRALIVALDNQDRLARIEARLLLVRIGKPAVPFLTGALRSPNKRMRWEAAKALAEIADPAAAPALVLALEDEDAGVRWLAAQGLIAIGRLGLEPLLGSLIGSDTSVWRREGAHHVLHDLARGEIHDCLAPVLAALEGIHPASQVPPAALAALSDLQALDRLQAGSHPSSKAL